MTQYAGNQANSEILQRMRENGKADENTEESISEALNRYMIFRIQDRKYALFADDVREIIGGIPIFFVPFTPPYIRGFINRHGEPYSVLDLRVIFERETLNSSTFLVLKRQDDQISLLIDEVLEIVKRPDSELHRITSASGEEDFFIGSINVKDDEEIFVIHLSSILEKLGRDLSGI